MSIPFSCIPSRNTAGGGFGDEQCWVILWTPNEDFGCITSHAQSTAATCFTGAVKSDVVHLIMVCWVLLLQSFGTEHIGHTRSFRIARALVAECLFADMSSGFRVKAFEGHIMPMVQLLIAAIQLRWHDRLYKFMILKSLLPRGYQQKHYMFKFIVLTCCWLPSPKQDLISSGAPKNHHYMYNVMTLTCLWPPSSA